MTTFVLMHGGGMGGWTWKYVRALLQAGGHDVFTPSFTGFAERSHLIGRDVDHDVHVTDIASLLRYEDLTDAVLVAHSYAGTVVPGVVAAEPGRVRRAIYLDAIVPAAGERVVTAMGFMPEEQAAGLDAMLSSGEGPVGSGVADQQREMVRTEPFLMPAERQQWLLDHLSDMPLRCTVSPIAVGAESLTIPVDYIAAEHTIMTAMHDRARALGWTMHSHSGDHALLAGDPEGTSALITAIAG